MMIIRILIIFIFIFIFKSAHSCEVEKDTKYPKIIYDLPASITITNIVDEAIKGNKVAQYKLGVMYFDKNYLEFSITKALFWLKKAANKEHVIAQTLLGSIYVNGCNTELNFDAAHIWIERATRHNNAMAEYLMGGLYSSGLAKKTNGGSLQIAFEWFLKSAKHGNRKAMMALNQFYNEGLAVKKSTKLANYWLNKATKIEPEIIYGNVKFNVDGTNPCSLISPSLLDIY